MQTNIERINNHQNALHHACIHNWKDGIYKIVFHESRDQSFFEVDSNMMTHLLLAAKFSSFETIEALLKHKTIASSINLANGDGVTPLIQVVMIGDARKDAQTRLKAEHGAQVDTKDNSGSTALKYAFVTGKFVTSQKVLIPNGANVTMKDVFGQTYLHLAVIFNWLDAVDILVKQDHDSGYIDVDVRDSHERTPLILACSHDSKLKGR